MNFTESMKWFSELTKIEGKGDHSQFAEDKIIRKIFEQVTPQHKTFVDIGAGAYDGLMSNTAQLVSEGWTGVGFDMKPTDKTWIYPVFVTPDNVCEKMVQYGVKPEFDFLNLDIDSSDYWVLKEILSLFRPAVICTEFNGCLDPAISIALRYENGYMWDGTDKYGYSFQAGKILLEQHGYTIVLNLHETNIFAIRADLIPPIPYLVQAKRNQYHPHNPGQHWVNV